MRDILLVLRSLLLLPLASTLGIAPTVSAQPATEHASSPARESSLQPLTMPERHVVSRAPVEPKVVLIGSPGGALPGLTRRLRAELGTLGLQLVSVEGRARDLQERFVELGVEATTQRAVAALRIEHEAGRQRVTLWLYDAVTGKMLFRQSDLRHVQGATPTDNASLQAVELVHASLLELNLPSQRARLETEPLPEPVARVVQPIARKDLYPEKPRGAFALEVGPALAATVGGAGPAMGVAWGGSWEALSWLAVGLEGFVPLLSSSVETPGGGSVDVAPLMARLVGRIEPWRQHRFSVAFCAGLGVLLGYSSGDSDETSLGQSDWGAVPATSFAVQLRVRLVRWLTLVGAGTADVSLYPLHVQVGGEQLERVGPVVLGGMLTLAASFGGGG